MCLRTDTGCPENRGTTGQLVIVHAKINRRKENNIFHSSLRLGKKRRVLTANFELRSLCIIKSKVCLEDSNSVEELKANIVSASEGLKKYT